MRVLFVGDAISGKVILEEIKKVGELVALAVPDRDQKKLLNNEFLTIKTSKINETSIIDKLKSLNIDLLINFNSSIILSKDLLSCLTIGGINFHPGLLPDYKGCFSSSWSLINNEKYVGFTYHFMNEKFDSGNILFTKSIKVLPEDDAFSLNYKIFQHGIPMLNKALDSIDSAGVAQSDEGKYYYNNLPHNGEMQLSWDEDYAMRFIKAMHFPPHPPAFLNIDDDRYNITNIKEFLELKNE